MRRARWGSASMGVALIWAAGLVGAACAPPAAEYHPLPIIDGTPRVLDDLDEVRDYVNAFPQAEYEQHEVPGIGRFFVDDIGDLVKQVVKNGDAWEPHVIELMQEWVEPGTVVLEVGAHIGTHTVPLSRLVGPRGRVYSFEPQRKIFRELHHNLALNGINNVVALRFAVGSGPPRVIEMNPATAGNEAGTGVGAGGDQAELRTLDSFRFERVSLLKIDVEHFENEVLDGAVDTIRRNRPVIVLEILGGEDYETATPDVLERIHGTWRKLEALGYRVAPIRKHDYIALPDEPDAS